MEQHLSVPSPHIDAIKDWLTEVAKSVAARDQPLSWITPLGIPCTQPYRDSTRRNVMTVLQVCSSRTLLCARLGSKNLTQPPPFSPHTPHFFRNDTR